MRDRDESKLIPARISFDSQRPVKSSSPSVPPPASRRSTHQLSTLFFSRVLRLTIRKCFHFAAHPLRFDNRNGICAQV